MSNCARRPCAWRSARRIVEGQVQQLLQDPELQDVLTTMYPG